MAKAIPGSINTTLDEALQQSKPLRAMYDGDERLHRLIDTARAIEGMPRHASTHAAGVVITEQPVYAYVPLASNDGALVCQYQMTTLEELGLLKMDFLGLRNLTVLDVLAAFGVIFFILVKFFGRLNGDLETTIGEFENMGSLSAFDSFGSWRGYIWRIGLLYYHLLYPLFFAVRPL